MISGRFLCAARARRNASATWKSPDCTLTCRLTLLNSLAYTDLRVVSKACVLTGLPQVHAVRVTGPLTCAALARRAGEVSASPAPAAATPAAPILSASRRLI